MIITQTKDQRTYFDEIYSLLDSGSYGDVVRMDVNDIYRGVRAFSLRDLRHEPKVIVPQEIYDRLREIVLENEEKISLEAEECCVKVAHAFENQDVVGFDVDYNPRDKSISLEVEFSDKLKFLISTETEGNGGTLNFSIIRDGEVIYMNFDMIDNFKENVDKYFQGRKTSKEQNEQKSRVLMFYTPTELNIDAIKTHINASAEEKYIYELKP